jgi:hypothetical protein
VAAQLAIPNVRSSSGRTTNTIQNHAWGKSIHWYKLAPIPQTVNFDTQQPDGTQVWLIQRLSSSMSIRQTHS